MDQDAPAVLEEPVGDRLRPVFIGGCPRSGTTLLGAMLGVGPTNLTVPEAVFKAGLLARGDDGGMITRGAAAEALHADGHFALWRVPGRDPSTPTDERIPVSRVVTDLVRAFGASAGKPGARVWIDHTPGNIRHAVSLARTFPDARFVHVVRDGRGVAASVLGLDWGPNRIEEAATWWGTHVAMGLAAERALGPRRVTTVRFEDLVRQPAATVRRLCAFLDLEYDDAMITRRDYAVDSYTVTDHRRVAGAPDPARAEAWADELSPAQVEEFEYRTGELSRYLGYPTVVGAGARPNPRHRRLGWFALDVARRGVIDRVRRRRSERGPHR